MPIATGAALLAAGLIGAGGSVASSLIGKSAAKTAAEQQTEQANKALDYTKEAEAPYLDLGKSSISKLMEGFNSGTFGPGSLPSFSAPTADEARATPGYQFTEEQGQLGISRQQAAAGGAFTGGTVKAGAAFNSGLADSTYTSTFNRNMAAYQAQLAKQSQEYQQLITPITIGSNAASGTSTNVANLMTQIGNSQAAGTVGSANAITSGIGGASNSLLQSYLLSQLNPNSSVPSGGGALPVGTSRYGQTVGLPAGIEVPG